MKTNISQPIFGWARRPTREVMVGHLGIGGSNPVRIQSMTTADTMDTAAAVKESLELARAGSEMVRLTAPSLQEARNLAQIRKRLRAEGCDVPLVADIHFTPNAALEAAEHVEKVRINPGNYADKKAFKVWEYTDEEYASELERIEAKFRPLVVRCRELGVAMRIGTNHGSLSDRIMNRFGDTPEGMVESALEFVRIAEDHGYRDLVLSMKASNVGVMIRAYRLLARRMAEQGMDYPFHLGVTEAGDGLEGRVKSAIGIGSLLADGIGDTVRVSLTEDPVAEIPAARSIVRLFEAAKSESPSGPETPWRITGENACDRLGVEPDSWHGEPIRRVRAEESVLPPAWGRNRPLRVGTCVDLRGARGAERLQEVMRAVRRARDDAGSPALEWVLLENPEPGGGERLASLRRELDRQHLSVLVGEEGEVTDSMQQFDSIWLRPRARPEAWTRAKSLNVPVTLLLQSIPDSPGEYFRGMIESERLSPEGGDAVALEVGDVSVLRLRDFRRLGSAIEQLSPPPALVVLHRARKVEPSWTGPACAAGSLLEEGFGDAVAIASDGPVEGDVELAYAILQGTRLRMTKTEYISCPSCGRTQFDLEETTARIKAATDHLVGVKIAVMGCIVNGPGEMADADFGYVGSGAGRIDLYVGKVRVDKNVPTRDAVDRLIDLIRRSGRWEDARSRTPSSMGNANSR